jgi:hypothetical protein
MGLGLDMQIADKRCQFVNPFHCERGGILSLTTLSGIQYATYVSNPTESTVPLGLMMHDQEAVDLYRANAPWSTHRAYPPYTNYPYLILGTVITNAVHPAADPAAIMPGAPAYLAPSGLITVSPTYNSRRIGTFMSMLNQPNLRVPGLLGPSFMRVGGDEKIVDPVRVMVNTAGWVKINIHI